MKKIIAATSLILILTFFYYPVFDDKKISFAIIFLCFVVLVFSIAKLYSPDEKDYESFEKEMDTLHDFDGIFQYTNDGFYFKQNNTTEFIKWDEITSVYFLGFLHHLVKGNLGWKSLPIKKVMNLIIR
ncbi:hypothetical protein [Chryseobacterium sp. CH21]|uniref:hypothetical protein n=1 Tax=Chryseobacterium sp. CH21 TaxID=713556 RepID=UPI001E626A12|nr:hypothetical protein [Chryseobacterium sp. CH21]